MKRSIWTWDDNPHSITECIFTWEAFASGSIFVDNKLIDFKELKGRLDQDFFFIMGGFMRTLCIPMPEFEQGLSLAQLLTDVGLTSSKTEGMQKIKEGSVKINTIKVSDPKQIITRADLFIRWILLQKGKGDAAIVMAFGEDC